MVDDLLPRLKDSLSRRLPDAMYWLERMVKVNSFTSHPAGVNQVGALTTVCFADLGFRAESVPSTDATYGAHLFLCRGETAKRKILLVTHLDTVFPAEEEQRNHFHWQEAPGEERIYGPGTVDIKGGTVLIWLVLQALRECAPEIFENTQWLVAANASEEVLSSDFAQRTAERCQEGVDAVLVFEGGPRDGAEWHLVTSRKGRAEYRICAEGNAAHAGSSHANGVNAIVGICDAVRKAAALTNYAADLTVNVGSISGGTVTNRVPHEAAAELEMRAYEPDILRRAGEAVEALASKTENGTKITIQCLGTTPAWPNDAATQGLFAKWEAAADLLGMPMKSVPRGGLSDANYLCHLGPTLDGLGPSGGNAHCSERSTDGTKVPEYVDVPSFIPKAMLTALALVRMLEEKA
ncbi:glutamate carboxypeptidase [Roseimicrobium gellanilyticum]|uniref:Glutamate carboxypeptidase n=1 Tax=Roseimicrobium gellanilyticum TaxID=748857 RepID=A0A366HS09_9BACT|nr:M20/M25/M40 family metallo-hydrolase [Roseimicrobium gellanilyticum]RBP45714.1 glutamate carboxypeptidase [Roseimicrobium gellanilyticum]